MPFTVGEVEAILTARDNMSPAMQLAAARVAELEYKLGTLGTSSVATFNVMNAQLAVAQERFQKLSEGGNTLGQSFNQVEGIAMRLIERMIVLYAVRGTFQFVVDIYEAADALVKLSAALDIPIPKLQVLQYSADQVGIPFTKLTGAVDTFYKKLADNKLATEDTLESIGLSLSRVFDQKREDQINMVVNAIAAIPDKLQRTKVEVAMFGTDAIDPMIMAWDKLGAAAKASGTIMSEDTVRVLSTAVTAYKNAWGEIKTLASEGFAWSIGKAEEFFKFFMSAAPEEGGMARTIADRLSPPHGDVRLDRSGIPPNFTSSNAPVDYIDKLQAETQGNKELTDEMIRQMGILKSLNLLDEAHVAQLTAEGKNLNINTAQFKEYTKLAAEKASLDKQLQTATENYWKAIYQLSEAGDNWRDTLETMDGEEVESIKWAMQAGLTHKELSLVFEESETKINAVAASLKNETAQMKLQAAATLEITRLTDELNQIIATEGGTAFQQQEAAIDKWAADLTAKMQKAGTDTDEFYDTLAKVVVEKYKKLTVDWTAINSANTNDTKASLQQVADKAQATYQEALKHVGEWSDSTIQKFRDTADAAQKAADTWGTSVATASTSAATSTAAASVSQLNSINAVTAGYYAQVDAAFAAAAAASGGLMSATGTRAPHLENGIWVDGNGKPMSGGTTSPGASNMFSLPGFKLPGFGEGGIVEVGEKGPERVALPQGSMVFPYGQNMGGGITVNVEMKVSGMLDLTTVKAVTNEISKQIIKEAKQALPYGSR